MGRARDDEPQNPEVEGAPPPPAGDSAGVYYMSIEEFEGRLPRPAPPEPEKEEVA